MKPATSAEDMIAKLDELKDALLGLGAYDWLIFTSPNGVTAFFGAAFFFAGFSP